MEIKVLKNTGVELKIEVGGEGHTFCNLLQSTLLEDEDVDMAGYDIPHPLVSSPTLYIRVKGKESPSKVLEKALKKIGKRSDEFQKRFLEAVGKTG